MAVISTNEIVVGYKVVGQQELQRLASSLNTVSDSEQKALDEMRKVNGELKKTSTNSKQAANDIGKIKGSTDGLSSSLKGVGPLIAGAFSLAAIKAFGQSVFNVTAEFEKMQAVLKNTLGSNSAAMLSMEAIKQFAKTTPFSVQELTASFVKLANQGFKPTSDEMRRLGDLASSTGKSFDQLTEAIIDAQVGEFERLKEFGIRASKEGENVRFTFKGVETQTKFTNGAIREYILSLGELNGVSGASAAISETLGGKVNNLGDAWDNFLVKIGTLLKPVLTEALTVTADFMDQINTLFGKGKTDAERYATTELETYKFYQKEVINFTDDQLDEFVNKQREALNKAQLEFVKYSKKANELGKTTKEAAKLGFGQKEIVDAVKFADKANQDIAASKARIAAAEEQIAMRLKNSNEFTFKKKELTEAELKALKDQYNVRLSLLALQKQERELRGQLANDPRAALTAELKYQTDKLNIMNEFSAKGVEIVQEEIQITTHQRQIAEKAYQESLMKNYQDTSDNEAKKQARIKAQMDATLEMTKNYAKLSKDISDKSTQDEIDNIEKTARIRREAEEARAKYERKQADEKDELIQRSFDLAAQTTNGLFNLQSQYAANDFARKQKQFDEEIKLADGNVQKIAEINEKRAAAEKEYKEKEFRANQLQAIGNIVFAAAPQIIKNIKNPFILGLITAGVITQTGLVLAQPVPEFYKGVENFEGGLAKVGERGSELIETKNGTFLSPDKPTLTYLPKGTNVITATKTKERMQMLNSSYRNGQDRFQAVDVTPIAEQISRIPISINNLDERGFTEYVRKGNRTTQILNKRKGL